MPRKRTWRAGGGRVEEGEVGGVSPPFRSSSNRWGLSLRSRVSVCFGGCNEGYRAAGTLPYRRAVTAAGWRCCWSKGDTRTAISFPLLMISKAQKQTNSSSCGFFFVPRPNARVRSCSMERHRNVPTNGGASLSVLGVLGVSEKEI